MQPILRFVRFTVPEKNAVSIIIKFIVNKSICFQSKKHTVNASGRHLQVIIII
jgi:putative flippase GtrA